MKVNFSLTTSPVNYWGNFGNSSRAKNTAPSGVAPVSDPFAILPSNKEYYLSNLHNIGQNPPPANETAFTGNKRIGRSDFVLALYQDKISCPCCGDKMHNYNAEAARELKQQIANSKGDELARTLRLNIGEIQASKRQLAYEIAAVAPKYPEKDISELLEVVSEKYVDSLRKKQICVMMDLINEIPNLHPKDKPVIDTWRYKQIKRIMQANEEGEFRNKLMVASFIEKAKENDIEIDEERIRRYFNTLPNSKKDTDAFVVKYMRRTPKETASNMVRNVEPTIEHIVPFTDSKNNGFSNLLVMCSDCNSARGSIPYNDFLAQHPEMLQNIDNYFEDIENIIGDKMKASKSVRKKFKHYVPNVKRTLQKYTNGALDFGIDDTKPQNTQANN